MALAPEVRVSQNRAMIVWNVPAEELRSSQAAIVAPYNSFAPEIRVPQSTIMVVCKGQVETPRLRAWYYTLDGHDIYVLKLGTLGKTLVFDISTGTWSWWASPDSVRWRPSIGMNWRSAGTIPINYGSNVVVGDDSTGTLWVLNPEQGYDDPVRDDDTDPVPFERVATGQMVTKDRNFIPVYSVDLTASLGQPSLNANSVTLEYSDDQGNTFVQADQPIVIEDGNYSQELSWRSLGLVRAPGRLFRITDNGSFASIDSLDVNA